MLGLNTWDILAFIGFIFLIIYFIAGKSLTWAAFFLGILAALIVCGIFFLKDKTWSWDLFRKVIVRITLTGVAIETAIRLSGLLKRKMA